jgi:LysM repeat protein
MADSNGATKQSKPADKRSGFDKWFDGVKAGVNDPVMKKLDTEIETTVNEYKQHLAGTPGFDKSGFNSEKVKMIILTETGAKKDVLTKKPMQIGNVGDPGLQDWIKRGGVVTPPSIKDNVTAASAVGSPSHNIKAGVGYLLLRHAKVRIESVPSSEKINTVQVKKGDSFATLARKNKTTVEELKQQNEGKNSATLKPGDSLKFREASMKPVIKDFDAFTPENIASKYNASTPKGVKDYTQKLKAVEGLLQSKCQEGTPCE